MCSLLPLLPLLLAWTRVAGAVDPTMPFMEYLDQDRLVCLKWGFDNLQGNITFQLVVNSTGWVGFGLSPNGGMKGSDIVIGGLGPDGSYFTDRHATGKSTPLVDEQQNYVLLSMSENDGQTIMTFQRTIKACDDKDFHITFTVPAVPTYYHCKVLQFPKLNTKHHIYQPQIEPVIENKDVVHHILLYRCPHFVTQTYEYKCYVGDVGDTCFHVLASWGIGGAVFEFPENVGIPVGGDN
uniref:Monooxygenase DBH like 1 n=1 Tax=Stegastes partitus TaxID=144197 RepID=A0A3B5B2L9_9TELE